MHETSGDLTALQALLDSSYEAAGSHLLEIHTPERRMTAADLSEELTGVCVLALATVSSDGRPIASPVDGLFYRGAFWFGSSPESVRFRHIRRRPDVSAVHARGEEMAVTVHGVAVETSLPAEPGFRDYCAEVYHPRYGDGWTEAMSGFPFARIEARRMYAFAMGTTTGATTQD